MVKDSKGNLLCPRYFTNLRKKIILFPEVVLTLPGVFLSRTVLGASLLFV